MSRQIEESRIARAGRPSTAAATARSSRAPLGTRTTVGTVWARRGPLSKRKIEADLAAFKTASGPGVAALVGASDRAFDELRDLEDAIAEAPISETFDLALADVSIKATLIQQRIAAQGSHEYLEEYLDRLIADVLELARLRDPARSA